MIKAGENIKGANLIIRSLEDIDIALLRKLSDLFKQKVKSGIFILGAKGPEDASVILSVTDDLVARGIKANELMGQITPLMEGSGGGRPQLAQAGSKQPQKLDGALVKARDIVKDKIMKLIKQTGLNIEKLYNRSRIARKKYIEEKVRTIIDDVRLNGDDALIKYTRRFDGVKLTAPSAEVDESEISAAFQDITPEFVGHLKTIINNVSTYYRKQLHKPCKVKGYDGIMLKEEVRPLDSVGIYIPAGTAPLVSSVYMTAVPAIIAGVETCRHCHAAR